jgi:hypothetical protein
MVRRFALQLAFAHKINILSIDLGGYSASVAKRKGNLIDLVKKSN